MHAESGLRLRVPKVKFRLSDLRCSDTDRANNYISISCYDVGLYL